MDLKIYNSNSGEKNICGCLFDDVDCLNCTEKIIKWSSFKFVLENSFFFSINSTFRFSNKNYRYLPYLYCQRVEVLHPVWSAGCGGWSCCPVPRPVIQVWRHAGHAHWQVSNCRHRQVPAMLDMLTDRSATTARSQQCWTRSPTGQLLPPGPSNAGHAHPQVSCYRQVPAMLDMLTDRSETTTRSQQCSTCSLTGQ